MVRPYDYTSISDIKALYKKQGGLCSDGCGTPITIGPKGQRIDCILEHEQALGRSGTNDLSNKSLRAKECARKKTFHPRSEATTIGSDIYEIAKTKRLERKRLGTAKERPKRKWASRKMKSRPFQKRVER